MTSPHRGMTSPHKEVVGAGGEFTVPDVPDVPAATTTQALPHSPQTSVTDRTLSTEAANSPVTPLVWP